MEWSGSVLRLERAQVVRFDGVEQDRSRLAYAVDESIALAQRALGARAEAAGLAGVEFAAGDGRVVASMPQGTRLDSGISVLRLPGLDVYECPTNGRMALAPGTRLLPLLSDSAVCVVSAVPLLAQLALVDADTAGLTPSGKGEPHSMRTIVLTPDIGAGQPLVSAADRMVGRRVALAIDGVVCATAVVIGAAPGTPLSLGVYETSLDRTMQLVAALRVCSHAAKVRLVDAGTFSFRAVRPLD